MITLCMGSSCFSRGNKKVLQVIRDYLSGKGLAELVKFKGCHCMGQCEHGPNIRISDLTVHHVDHALVIDTLEKAIFEQNKDPHENH